MSFDQKILIRLLAKKQYDRFLTEYRRMLKTEDFDKKEQFKNIEDQYFKVQSLMSTIDDCLKKFAEIDDGWIVSKLTLDKSYIAVRRGSSVIEAKYQMVFDTGLQHLCKLLTLTSSYKEILPFCYHSTDIVAKSPLEKDVLIKFKIPFLNQRNLVLRIRAIDRIDKDGTIVLLGEGVSKSEAGRLVKGLKGDYMNLKFFVCQIKMMEGRYKMSSYAIIDSSVDYLPDWVIGRLVKVIGSFLVDKFAKRIAEQPTKQWQQSYVKENKQLSECISVRLGERVRATTKL